MLVTLVASSGSSAARFFVADVPFFKAHFGGRLLNYMILKFDCIDTVLI